MNMHPDSILGGVERVPVDSLSLYPGNPRRHDLPMIAESLRENGQYRPLICQQSTRYVLAGNGTLEAAVSIGWPEIDAVFLGIDDIRAKKIVLVDNRANDAASYSSDDLAALLSSVGVSELTGTGYTSDDLARLCADLPDGFAELDPDAPAPERDPVTCPQCGHQWILGG